MEDKINDVARRLKYLRTVAGLTLEEAALKLDTNKSTVNRYETGKQIPDIKYLFKHEEVFGRSAEWILSGHESDETSFSLKEKQYIELVGMVATVLSKTLSDRGLKLKWQHSGQVFKFLFQLSLEFVHEGSICLDPQFQSEANEELMHQLKTHIEGLFTFISDDIFE